ncbi:MAG: PASTA domain-containing protein [Planctomycetaceae bacterium]
MMTRNSLRRWIELLALPGLILLVHDVGHCQTRPRTAPPVKGTTSPNPSRPANKPPRPVGVQPLPAELENVQAANVEPLSPELETFLMMWEKQTSNIKSLEGVHHRFTYDATWEIEKRAKGNFYYVAPDRGRIDLKSVKIPKGTVSKKKGTDGKPYRVEGDMPEMWISNGKVIIEVNEIDKTYSKFPLPEDMQGKNIMDGPLPFLFGMPADVAKKRYHLELLPAPDKGQILVKAKPLWKADAANYSEATVLLNEETYLPIAVKLVHPGGNEETVYRFDNIQINKKPSLFEEIIGVKDPFDPPLRGYQPLQNENDQLKPEQALQDRGTIQKVNGERPAPQNPTIKKGFVPNVVGMHFKKAEAALKAAGYQAAWIPGDPATFKEQSYTAYAQSAKPGEKLKPGETVRVTLYEKFPVKDEK